MPLVVPGITSSDSSKTEEWSNKLVGKKIGENSDATASLLEYIPIKYLLMGYRPLRELSCRRKPESLSQDRWLPRTLSQTGEDIVGAS
jgi:hypothetical protein